VSVARDAVCAVTRKSVASPVLTLDVKMSTARIGVEPT
jgi:hypothetical protein